MVCIISIMHLSGSGLHPAILVVKTVGKTVGKRSFTTCLITSTLPLMSPALFWNVRASPSSSTYFKVLPPSPAVSSPISLSSFPRPGAHGTMTIFSRPYVSGLNLGQGVFLPSRKLCRKLESHYDTWWQIDSNTITVKAS